MAACPERTRLSVCDNSVVVVVEKISFIYSLIEDGHHDEVSFLPEQRRHVENEGSLCAVLSAVADTTRHDDD